MRSFRLYTEEQHWWSFNDYGAVLDVMQQLKPARVLEFGPGSSTLALVEGGAQHIDTCEDAPDWAAVYEERLVARFPDVVRLHRYTFGYPLTIPAVDSQLYDLALIDGPRNREYRAAVVVYALERCRAVLVPTEDAQSRMTLEAIARAHGWHITIEETGPLAGGFALLVPPILDTIDDSGFGIRDSGSEPTAAPAVESKPKAKRKSRKRATGDV